MTSKTPEELIHGLIDGELTADEQVRAEQLLAERGDLRQLHDDLRALQASLGAMPRRRAPADLQANVLARLAQTPRTTQTKPAATDERIVLRFPRGLRPWIWPAAALAAALVMMITNRDQHEEPAQVADARRPAAPEASIGPAPDRGSHRDESQPADFSQDSATFEAAPEKSELAKSAERRPGGGGLGGGAGSGDSNRLDGSDDGRLGTSASGKSAAIRRLEVKDNKNSAAPAQGSSELSGRPMSEGGAQRYAKSPADQPVSGTQFGADGPSAKARSNFSFERDSISDGTAAAQDLVVTCYFSSDLAGKQALNEVLGRQNFSYQTPPINLLQAKEDQRRKEQRQILDYDGVINGTIAGRKATDLSGPEVERVVNAEASWPQVQQALEELYRRPDVTSLHVAPSSAAPARQLVREFNRGRLPVDTLSVNGIRSSGVNQPVTGPQSSSERVLELADKEATGELKGEASGAEADRASRARAKQHKRLAKEQSPVTPGEAEGTALDAPKSKLAAPAPTAAAASKPASAEPAATEALGVRSGQPATNAAPTARPSTPALRDSRSPQQSAATAPATARAYSEADAKQADDEKLREEAAQRKKSEKKELEAVRGVRGGSAGSSKPQEPVGGQGMAIHSRRSTDAAAGEARAGQQAALGDRVRVQFRLRVAPQDAAPNAAADVKPAEPAR